MKIRVYKRANGRVDRIERDPVHYEDGLYSDEFHPHIYLKDKNDPSQGYENVPEWFVIDKADLPNCPIEYMTVVNDTVGEDTVRRRRDDDDKNALKNEYKNAINNIADPQLKKLIRTLALGRKLIDE